jgi:hypothetical protein
MWCIWDDRSTSISACWVLTDQWPAETSQLNSPGRPVDESSSLRHRPGPAAGAGPMQAKCSTPPTHRHASPQKIKGAPDKSYPRCSLRLPDSQRTQVNWLSSEGTTLRQGGHHDATARITSVLHIHSLAPSLFSPFETAPWSSFFLQRLDGSWLLPSIAALLTLSLTPKLLPPHQRLIRGDYI